MVVRVMSVTKTAGRVVHIADGTKSYSLSELHYTDSAKVIVSVFDGSSTINPSHTISIAGTASPIVSFASNVTSGYTIYAYNNESYNQTAQFNNDGPFFANDHENTFDKITVLSQLSQDKIDRSLQLSVFDYNNLDVSTQMPVGIESGAGISIDADLKFVWVDSVVDAGTIGVSVVSAQNAESTAVDSASIAYDSASDAYVSYLLAEEGYNAVVELYEKVGLRYAAAVTTDTAVSAGYMIRVSPTTDTITLSLPTASNESEQICIKNISAYMTDIILDCAGTDSVDGYGSAKLTMPYQAITLVSDGSGSWHITHEENDGGAEFLPVLTYSSTTVVGVAYKTTEISMISTVLQDGKRYSTRGALTCNFATTGMGGLDTGSVGNSKFYYLYLVPNGTAWRGLGVKASLSEPETFAATNALYRYIGAIRTTAAGAIREFRQDGCMFLDTSAFSGTGRQVADITVADASLTDNTWARIDTYDAAAISLRDATTPMLPATWGAAYIGIAMSGATAGGKHWMKVSAQLEGDIPNTGAGDPASGKIVDIFVRGKSRSVTYKWIYNSSSDGWLYAYAYTAGASDSLRAWISVNGWMDKYLVRP